MTSTYCPSFCFLELCLFSSAWQHFKYRKNSSEMFVFLFPKLNSFSYKEVKSANGYSVCNEGPVKNYWKNRRTVIDTEEREDSEGKKRRRCRARSWKMKGDHDPREDSRKVQVDGKACSKIRTVSRYVHGTTSSFQGIALLRLDRKGWINSWSSGGR